MDFQFEKLEIGRCYTYLNLNAKEVKCGFIIVDLVKKKEESHIICAVVEMEKNGEVDLKDFQKASLFTYDIYNPKKSEMGVSCFEFHKESFEIFKKLKYIGQLRIDKNKFVVGSGKIALPEPMFSMLLMKNISTFYIDNEKTSVETICHQ